MIGTNKKTGQDIEDCVETCKQGLVLLVGGLTDEEQNNVATSLTVTWRIKLYYVGLINNNNKKLYNMD